MSEATKKKLVLLGLEPEVVDELEKAGITLPAQIKKMKDSDLKKVGLSATKLAKLRAVVPESKE